MYTIGYILHYFMNKFILLCRKSNGFLFFIFKKIILECLYFQNDLRIFKFLFFFKENRLRWVFEKISKSIL